MKLRKPVQKPEDPEATSAAVGIVAGHVNLSQRSSEFVPVETDSATNGEALLEGNIQLVLGREIGVAGGVTDFQDRRATVLVTNF